MVVLFFVVFVLWCFFGKGGGASVAVFFFIPTREELV